MRFSCTLFCLVIALLGVPVALAQTPAAPNPNDYVQPVLLRSRLPAALAAIGDRLEKSGNERVTLAGTLTRSTGTSQVRVIWQLPGQYRIDETKDGSTRTVTFDGARLATSSGALTAADADLVESVINDSAENFFVSQSRGAATRVMGYYFRTDDGKAARYAGPWYDIYQVFQPRAGTTAPLRPKLYLINSRTKLLEQVHYQVDRSGRAVRVMTQISNWQALDKHRVAASVVRYEDGQPVLQFSYSTVLLGAKATDGVFTPTETQEGALVEGGRQ